MHTGDMFQSRNMPFIDFVNSGGSATEFAQTLRRAESGIEGVDRIMAGHSNSLLTWNDFAEYVEFMNQFLAAGEQGMRSGASVEAVASAFLGQPHDGFEIDPQRVRDNLQAIYDGR